LTDPKTETKHKAKDGDGMRKRRQLIDGSTVRFVKLKESYVASGTMEVGLPTFLMPFPRITRI
jgi:hypothetical protein